MILIVPDQVFHSLASDDVLSISLVQQCIELELMFGTNVLEQCLKSPDDAVFIVQSTKPQLIDADWSQSIHLASLHPC